MQYAQYTHPAHIQNTFPLNAASLHYAIFQIAIDLQQAHATSMDQIATTANVSKRTVYDHFKTKKALFESMLNAHWQTVSISHQQLFLEQQPIAAQLTQFAKVFLKFLYQPDTIALFRLLIAEINQFPDLVSNLLLARKRHSLDY